MKDELVSEEKNKPVLDEQTLAKLLEAAYVLQEHNREMRELELGFELKRDQIEAEERASGPSSAPSAPPAPDNGPAADYTFTLGQIVETQHRIQVRHLELDHAMSLVAERVVEIGRAYGAGIGLTDGNIIRYRAASGFGALPAGTEIPLDKALCIPCIRTGQAFRCADVNPEFLLDSEECRRRGIQALIAVPVFHNGKVAGGLELYYSQPHVFTEQDVHTCQLMAGLVTEALARDEEISWKRSLASERAVMLQALERLKPNLAALVDKPAANEGVITAPAASAGNTYLCRKCRHPLVGEEQFCGQCGTPRGSEDALPSMQSKVASLWHMQEALKKEAAAEITKLPPEPVKHGLNHAISENSLAASLEDEMPDFFMAPDVALEPTNGLPKSLREMTNEAATDTAPIAKPDSEIQAETVEETEEERASEALALAKPTAAADWSSAHSAREFFEQVAGASRPGALTRFWNSRRGDIYLAIAVVLVACVIRWGIWSNHPVGATGTPNAAAAGHHKSPDTDLSVFDRMLISLGLAEAPPTPEDNGNPNAQVWVDLHTALYYCAGTDLYGKTETGKYTTQREAQLDQFEPAYRKACN
ncbi:MAG TPA: GAF domain-containing protein [Candidatus Sulfotelmatobacter sp.]|nr:GAF domain-containing protein [Candidatus Sulfotelmatobacter sp.]